MNDIDAAISEFYDRTHYRMLLQVREMGMMLYPYPYFVPTGSRTNTTASDMLTITLGRIAAMADSAIKDYEASIKK